jgi:hypothetical protein
MAKATWRVQATSQTLLIFRWKKLVLPWSASGGLVLDHRNQQNTLPARDALGEVVDGAADGFSRVDHMHTEGIHGRSPDPAISAQL